MYGLIDRIARVSAVLGGLALTALIALTCISVSGRGLNTLGHSDFLTGLSEGMANALIGTGVGPVTGDFEVVEAGVAFAIFAFLPICQLHGAHATVDVFTNTLPAVMRRWIAAFWEVVLTLAILLITWRLFAGMQSKMAYDETTFLLQFPVWWGYAASFAAAVVASLVGVYCAMARVAGVVTGRAVLPEPGGTAH